MNVLITGASRGIGKATAEEFLKNGYNVYTPARDELDLNSRESIKNYADTHADMFDIIVNNAGINNISKLENIDDNQISDMLQVNLVAPLMLIRDLTLRMKRLNYGRIVNIGSIWAVVSKSGRALYSAAKNALHGITNTLAIELAPYNILVNTVCPGFTATELTYQNNSKEEIGEIEKKIPLARMAAPEEIARLINFLCSDKNTYLTGQKIVIDGGFTIV